MPNKNYLAGRRLEYLIKTTMEASGWAVIRASGSRGFFDLVAFGPKGHGHVYAIQCKVVSKQSDANRMLADWRENPPFPPGIADFAQQLVVKVKGESGTRTVTV